MTAPIISRVTDLTRNSFTVSWTITNSSNMHSYIITWINLRTGDMDNTTVPQNTNSYNVSRLNGVDNYNVSVAANNPCGMMESDSITVYGKNVHTYYYSYVHALSRVMLNLVNFIILNSKFKFDIMITTKIQSIGEYKILRLKFRREYNSYIRE